MGVCVVLAGMLAAAPSDYFHIRVVDEQTGRGVPLVELSTVHQVQYVTDSAGNVAFHEPELMNKRVFFHVTSHGYAFPADGFGFHGVALDVRAGKRATIRVRRLNIAERLYRVTGAGIYRDSVMLGWPTPDVPPLLNGDVLGQDSVVCAVYRGRVYWFWGDTNRPQYPLGNFHVSGAVSELPGRGGLAPAEGVRLDYFVDETGFARPMARMPGEGPTWINGLVVVPDERGRPRLVAHYVKVKPPLTVYRHGLCVFDDAANAFRHLTEFAPDETAYPGGHPFIRRDADGVERVYFAEPYPLLRVRATLADLRDIARYERFSCELRSSDDARSGDDDGDRRTARSQPATPVRIDTDGAVVRYAWRRGVPPHSPQRQRQWSRAGRLAAGQGLLALCDPHSGRAVMAHAGSVYFNAYRRRYVMIATEAGGETSFLGDVWFAEADTPVGPWVYGVRVVQHDRYSFYNPKHHPFFDEDGGRKIYFEGTYTRTFSKSPAATPRYDYNQIMYRLDLTDPRTVVPTAVYRAGAWKGEQLHGPAHTAEADVEVFSAKELGGFRPSGAERFDTFPPPLFFAFDRPRPGTVAVFCDESGRLRVRPADATRPGDARKPDTGRQRSEKAVSFAPRSAGTDSRGPGTRRAHARHGEEVTTPPAPPDDVAFFALPAETTNPPKMSAVLWEVRSAQGAWLYGTARDRLEALGTEPPRPVCLVFRNPIARVRTLAKPTSPAR